MSPIDPTTLLRELRPPADARPDEEALERLLHAGPLPVRRARDRYVRPVAIAGTLAVVATAGIALVPGDGAPGVPGVLQRAEATMTKPDTILHYRASLSTTVPGRHGTPRTIESWQTTDGRRERTIFDGGALESARDQVGRTFTTYSRERDELLKHTDPAWFDGPTPGPPGLVAGNRLLGITTIGDLAELLQRARDGEDGVSLAGRTEIRGTSVDHLRITSTIRVVDPPAGGERLDPRNLPGHDVETVRDVYLRIDDGLPVRVVDRDPLPGSPDRVVDYLEVEQLPLDATTEDLLRMGPHPGASTRDEGRFD